MEQIRLNKLLSRIVDLKPGEEKLVLLLFTCFFLITSPHTIIKALRYADLLSKEGVGGLPIAYLFAAVVTGLVVLFHSKIQFKISSQLMFIGSLIFFIITGLLLHLLLLSNYGLKSALPTYVYWVWASVLIIVLLTQFWLTVNKVFNPREAKRLIGFCGSGGILGGIMGGLLARFLTNADLAHVLLPLACGLLFACIFVIRAIFVIRKKMLLSTKLTKSKEEISEVPRVGFMDSLNAVRKEKYLILIAGLVFITVIVSTFIDFQFSSAVDASYKTKEAKQAFFGTFFAALMAFSFFLSLFLTSKILKKFRPRFPLLLTPIMLFLCSLGILFAPFTLLPAIFIKGSDESLGFSLNQSVRELLYIPVASDLRAKVKPFIDMFINRFAKVFAAILLLIFALSLSEEVKYLTPVFGPGLSKDLIWGVMAFLILWVIISVRVGKEYNRVIKDRIPPKFPNIHKYIGEKLDIDYIKTVIDAIDSKNRSSVLYAMFLFDLLERNKLTPEIKKAISYKADEVTATSLGSLLEAEGGTWFPGIDDDIPQESFVTEQRLGRDDPQGLRSGSAALSYLWRPDENHLFYRRS
jgi:AAA family ATP:ADP antiporter